MPKKRKKKTPKEKVPKKGKNLSRRNDVSIVSDIKEPFSWYRFWDETVLGNWKAFKSYLDKKGILYLLLSPFRYRARLIARLWIIVFCVLLGVVPRSVYLVNKARHQYRTNEFVNIKDSIFYSGAVAIRPLQSSQKGNVHLLAFVIDGDTASGVSSLTSGYDVRLTPRRGVQNPEDVTYRYHIVPFTADQRILLVAVDMSKNQKGNGVFDLWVNQKDQLDMSSGMEIVLSDSQKTTELYNGTIHLSGLSKSLSVRSSSTVIDLAQSRLDDTLNAYRLNAERLTSIGVELGNSFETVEQWVKDNLYLENITDDSTTAVVTTPPDKEIPVLDKLSSSITYLGQTFTEDDYRQSTDGSVDSRYVDEIITVIELSGDVHNKLTDLNRYRYMKYSELYQLSRTLSEPIKLDQFTEPVKVSDTKVPLEVE